jgi:uncharacterized membrane protein
VEELLQRAVGYLVPVVEACGAVVIVLGALWAFARFVWVGLLHRDAGAFIPVRLTLGRFLALGLEFQLASDVLRTAVAPSFRELAQLAAVAAIRTALNYFLSREISEERREVSRARSAEDGAAGPVAAAPAAGPARDAADRVAADGRRGT